MTYIELPLLDIIQGVLYEFQRMCSVVVELGRVMERRSGWVEEGGSSDLGQGGPYSLGVLQSGLLLIRFYCKGNL